MANNPPPFTMDETLKGARELAELHASVSYAGNIRPDPAKADPDDETPGDETDDEDASKG